jgi:predicted nucleic acid-binding protein
VSLVLDSSVTLAWIHGDETTPAVRDVFARIGEEEVWVPALWRLEVANVLEMGVRRGRHDATFRDAMLADLALLPFRLDPETDTHAWGATTRLATRHGLTLYESAYLELARRRNAAIATLDQALRRAALAEGVPLLGRD